eukprot:UN03644
MKLNEFIKCVSKVPLVSTPGEEIYVHGCDYDILCALIEYVSQMNFDEFLKEIYSILCTCLILCWM